MMCIKGIARQHLPFLVFSQHAPYMTSHKHITVGKTHVPTQYQEIRGKGKNRKLEHLQGNL